MASSNLSSFYAAKGLVISCGTVVIDIESASLMLIMISRDKNEGSLPRGPKRTNESLEDAAVRLPFEKTKIKAKLLPAPIGTRQPRTSMAESTGQVNESAEPIAVTQRVVNGVLRTTFWYAASRDNTAGSPGPDDDKYYAWLPAGAAAAWLKSDNERRVVQAAVAAFKASQKAKATATAQA